MAAKSAVSGPGSKSSSLLAASATKLPVFKITIIGDSGVGKSALMKQLATRTFDDSSSLTIGVDFCHTDVPPARLQIWDTAGQERFRTVTRAYYRGSDAVLFVFDVTQKDTFAHIQRWVQEAQAATSRPGKVHYVLVGNKSDLVPAASSSTPATAITTAEQGEALAKSLGMPYFQTSAKSYASVWALFEHVAEALVKGGTTGVAPASVSIGPSSPYSHAGHTFGHTYHKCCSRG